MKGKKILALSLATIMTLGLLAACGGPTPGDATPPPTQAGGTEVKQTPVPEKKPVTITVVTTYSGNDANAALFQKYVAAWEAETGNKVQDGSETSSETFKARVIADFEMGSEPDVLFFFNGVDSNPFVSQNKVVSIDEIRGVYPEYATNMKDDAMGASPYDGKNYSVPVNGFWEGLFVNKAVLAEAGVEIPTAETTWDEFMDMCEAIKAAGKTPIAVALGGEPHYWFEFCIYNHLSPATHNVLPELPGADGKVNTDNAQYKAWVAGINDIKTMYEKGYFPQNTLTASNDEIVQAFCDGKAAFLLDGSWRGNSIKTACGADTESDPPVAPDETLLENFTVAYVGGQGQRKAGDIISGLSSGYFITRKAWDDPDKRDAAVSFVEYMTTDAVVSDFAQVSATALKNGVQVDESTLTSLDKAGLAMVAGSTGSAGAVQDQITQPCRVPLFEMGMPKIVTGEVAVEDAINDCLTLIAAERAGQ